jgi:predicted dehydrogenase
MSSLSPEVVVAGAGPMAEEHIKALLRHGLEADRVLVAARRPEAAAELAARHGVRAAALDEASAPTAIVAVSEDVLAPVASALLARGARRVLVEKPGSLEPGSLAGAEGDVYVGYNRRFYPSVTRARELIAADGGPLALTFDFTEIEERVLAEAGRRGLGERTLRRWGIANSLHVIDLAFHLAGAPVRLDVERAGALAWHPSGSVFSGSGRTDSGALFAYVAVWGGAGRWGVEVTTAKRRLVLRPLEALWEQRRGSFDLVPVVLPREPEGVKPGLSGQLAAFLAEEPGPTLCGRDEAARRLELAERMLGYV